MNINFTPEPNPELGFGIGEPLQLTLRPDGLWITVVTDDAIWKALCEASQHSPDLGGDWLIESGITGAEQLEIIAAPGVIRLRRREGNRFRA
ncbi:MULTISPECIES: hypothetical protein [Serratia]|uniref:hypothetical protein n=1 Tax=Serratia TaxID=613 RepID=UPI00025E3962|nr:MULTISPECIES: hypothetical protein [Serratia]ANS44997.1 hypothetical protein Q5A_022915 [Serratia inhibens PRI-2C]EKF62232.1 hypothetical protein B194_4822 [Serratia plymuthica A30]